MVDRLAWRVQVRGFPDAIIGATSRSAARYRGLNSARDAGYDIEFTESIRVTRAKEFDPLMERYAHRVWSEEALRYLQENE